MNHHEDWKIPGADAMPIYGTTHRPTTGHPPRAIVLICHGFKGYKEYGFLPQLAETFAAHGLVAHRFNFSHSGMTPRVKTFERPDLFERDTWSKQIHDVDAVAQAAAEGSLPGGADSQAPMFWFGHSRGGVAVLLTAARWAGQADGSHACLAGVIAAAAPHRACHLPQRQVELLREQGYLDSPSSRTGQVLRIGKGWLEDYQQNRADYDPVKAVGQIACPVLIVHGDADVTVPVQSAYDLKEAGGPDTRLEIVERASHTFNAPNPLPLDQDPPAHTRQLIDIACDFVGDQLDSADGR